MYKLYRYLRRGRPIDKNYFQKLVRSRSSIRGFKSTPVNSETITEVLEDAQFTPSNCNTQPWDVHIVSGNIKDELSRKILEANRNGQHTADFSFDTKDYYARYSERQIEQAIAYQQAMGIDRNDREGRMRVVNLNYEFFHAPHVAFLFMPSFGDNVRVAADIGMYGQSFLLALAARGLGGVPQTSLGFFANQVRESLDISEDMKLLFGISFGYPDEDFPGALMRVGRDSVNKSVAFHS
ncbi:MULTISPECIES: nitroreductase [Virgibacillus]|uniref:Coenzyme F420:L-glutamate ligase n=2 Tax=Virgibacillus TaxID=84406 RepID=A0A024QEP7_9BACI|nr:MULTISPECIES: nitroreductase [Virgibacillus]MYL43234.1 nitroreductase [Virgibacillus massiliensis]CDQ40993.1 Coenzyme F420:L-glutamate ligase [Virgibacillus massiliensis]